MILIVLPVQRGIKEMQTTSPWIDDLNPRRRGPSSKGEISFILSDKFWETRDRPLKYWFLIISFWSSRQVVSLYVVARGVSWRFWKYIFWPAFLIFLFCPEGQDIFMAVSRDFFVCICIHLLGGVEFWCEYLYLFTYLILFFSVSEHFYN